MTVENGMDSLEWTLLCGKDHHQATPSSSCQAESDAFALVSLLVAGKYSDVLRSEAACSLLGTNSAATDKDVTLLAESLDIQQFVKGRASLFTSENAPERQIQLLCIGVASLYAFLQSGWTGPLLDCNVVSLLPELVREKEDDLRKAAMVALVEDGEEVYPLTATPAFLVLARTIIVDCADLLKDCRSGKWWQARCLLTQQKLLDNPSDSLKNAVYEAMDAQTERLPDLDSWRDLHARFNVERGLAFHFHEENHKTVHCFTAAQEASKLEWNLTGALGKRTKFQTFEVSQLVVLAKSSGDAAETSAPTPKTLDLNDDTLLETPSFTAEANAAGETASHQSNLKVIDQCILLAFCLNVKNTNPSDGLTTEEMLPYVRRVLENPNNWMVHTMALLLRSRLESHKSRTVERACFQLQALVDQFALEESSVAERMLHIFSIELPPKWEMERELGERFISLGATRSALDIFERLEMWEDAISCYQMLEQPKKAEALVLERLKITPRSPKLHCLLGDIRADPEQYQLAWSLSDGRYARAMRSLGAHHFKRGEWTQAIESYHRALAINSLFENSWFVMGCAAMRAEEWDTAVRAFSRVVSIDHENGEAWTNLASVYVRQKKKREAWRALREAVRQHYDNPKIWENYMFTSVDLGEFQEAMHAMERVLEGRWDKAGSPKDQIVDVEVLDILVTAITDPSVKDASGQPATKHAQRLGTLLNSITSKVATQPALFACAARFARFRGLFRKALDYRLKAYRCMLHHPQMTDDERVFELTVKRAMELVDAYVEDGPKMEAPRMASAVVGEDKIDEGDVKSDEPETMVCKDWQYQARMTLKTLIGRTKTNFEDTPLHDSLKEKLQEIVELS